MILDQKQIQQLAKKGVKVTTSDGQPISVKTPRKAESELDYLRAIAGLLDRLASRPDPQFPVIRPPDVIVKPADVIVTSTEHEPIRKWHFQLTKDWQGRTTEIVATAME